MENGLGAGLITLVIAVYFLLLLGIAQLTSRGADTESFFVGNRQSPWYVVAFGMIGASLSGVTFISVPGAVLTNQFAYFQLVLGYLLGYLVIGLVLLPLYYRLQLTSIYGYLSQRFGFWSYKSGAFFFILSRMVGASSRVFLTASALQLGFREAGIPFWLTTVLSILLIWVYTRQGGIKTIVWTDTLQTAFMIGAAVVSVYLIKDELNWSFTQMLTQISSSEYAKTWFWDAKDAKYFFKQFFSGAFIAIVMTGLDQDMMQKNLSCRNLGDAQKNMFWFSIVLVFVNLIFLSLGALLYFYAAHKGIELPAKTDQLYPFLAFKHFSLFAGIIFLLGIVAATYSSADSSLTALTTSFCVDFLEIDNQKGGTQTSTVKLVHIGFSVLMVLVVLAFKQISDAYPESNVLEIIFTAAGYTYGPLLGLFSFGLFTTWQVRDKWVPLICVVALVASYTLNIYSEEWLWGYKFGFEILMLNGFITFIGLLCITIPKEKTGVV